MGANREETALRWALALGWLPPATVAHVQVEWRARRARGEAASLSELLAPLLSPAQNRELGALLAAEDSPGNGNGHAQHGGVPTLAGAPTVERGPEEDPTLAALETLGGTATIAGRSGRNEARSSAASTPEGAAILGEGWSPESPPTGASGALREAAERAYARAAADDPLFAPQLEAMLEFDPTSKARAGAGPFEVFDRRLGRRASCRHLPPDVPSVRVEAFLREAGIVARLDHPSVPSVYELGRDGAGGLVLLMRRCEGETLRARLARRQARPGSAEWRALLEVVLGLAEAIAAAHRQGVVLRHLRPESVLVGRYGEVLILDWSLACLVETAPVEPRDPGEALGHDAAGVARTVRGQLLGTPGYMAPEQARGLAGPPADVFALGAILCEVLSGRLPVAGTRASERLGETLAGRIATPRGLGPDVPAELDSLAAAALAADPAQRTVSAAEFAADLRAYLAGRRVATHRYRAGERLRRSAARHPTLLVGLGLGLVLGSASLALGGFARVAARDELVRAARRVSHEAQDALAAARELSPGLRTGRALAVLHQAQRWHDLAPEDVDAARAVHRAAMALGEVAQASEQWSLATRAFAQAEALGVDDAAASAARAGVPLLRDAEQRRRAEEIRAALARARAGELDDPEARREAVFQLARYREEQTVRLLAEALEETSGALLAAEGEVLLSAEEPTTEERAAGERPIEGLRQAVAVWTARVPGQGVPKAAEPACREAIGRLEQRDRLRAARDGRLPLRHRALLARLQRERLPPGLLAQASFACETLGRLGIREGAVPALGRYICASLAEREAAVAGLALCRLGGTEALNRVDFGRDRFGTSGHFARRLERALQQAGGTRRDAVEEPRGAADYAERGSRRTNEGRHREAIADLTRAIELDPTLEHAWTNRGNARMAIGDLTGAISDLSEAIALAPTKAPIHFNRGNVQRALKEFARALADYEQAIVLDPNFAPAYGNRALVHLDQGQPERALADLDRASALDPTLVSPWICRAMALMDLGRHEPALASARQAIELDDADARAWILKGQLLRVLRRVPESIAALERAVELAPDRPVAWGSLAHSRGDAGDYVRAVEDLTRAIELRPANPIYWANRAGDRTELGDFTGAVADLDRALELQPNLPVALTGRARARHGLGDLGGAEADLQRAIELAPGYSRAWLMRGLLCEERGNADGALRAYSQAIRCKPSYALAYLNRGSVRARLRRLAAARADLDRCIALDPASHLAWINRGVLRQRQGDLAGALADFDRGLQLNPLSVSGWSSRSILRLNRGDAAGALRDASRALEIAPAEATAWKARGNVYIALGRYAEARADFDESLRLFPAQADVLLNRGAVRGQLGDEEGAMRDIERSLQLEEDGAAYANRAQLLARRGERARALADLDRAVALEPRAPRLYLLRGRMHLDEGARDAARADLERVCALAPPGSEHAVRARQLLTELAVTPR